MNGCTKNLNTMKKIWKWIKSLFVRENRVEMAVKVLEAIKTFTDTSIDEIIEYALMVVAPTTSTAVTLIKNFISNDLPSILLAYQLIDASDESKTVSEQCELVSKKAKEEGTIKNETDFAAAIAVALSDGELSFVEAKKLVSNYLKS